MPAADVVATLGLFLAACLATGVMTGVTRASTPGGILRETGRAFVSLAGGIVLLCVAIWFVTAVAQS